ncbi:flagellar hook-associated protein FlgL [Larsenimonas rhizosphaerae]|uniref:Flagellar hook-associated protein FlgL n=1 Tax=Larsenimonas rhizosphaerae TaxID=2944682 RepID=A0AA41ZLN5_9GAMM|nr:flagellar hook-associated protein FlgL [Larsenimonas rhizosphaerae]MCM2130405.1 flagellar hook-associated protein FlgL [Larsenimonas rhizosphaerae]MCX2523110.1 flagellar hook-associated protein FlgL [Larsenimonas rhizosphaerae]
MRLSTASMFSTSLSAMLNQQSKLTDVSLQMSTGRRVVTASDDPSAASQALITRQSLSETKQYADARTTMTQNMALEETILNSVTSAIQSAQDKLVQAGNGTLSDSDRLSLATAMDSIYQELVGLANSTDGNGNYLFSGSQTGTVPFGTNADGTVSYQGDNNQQFMKVDASRSMESFDSGLDVFSSITAGAKFVARAEDSNAGTATFTGPSVSNSADAEYGNDFSIAFQNDGAGNITYSVENLTAGTTTSPQPYTPGSQITFGGLSLAVDGTPEDGDSFSVARGREQDNNFINTLKGVVDALSTEQNTDVARARLSNTLSSASRQMSNGLDNVLTVRSSVGARMNEVDVLDTIGGDRKLAYTDRLSSLVDLDYAEAISEYTLKQTSLEAAQKTFSQVQRMSLFDLI